ncbi:acyl transferase/acyl hydrolase/lysophospholipase [Pelagophyceae sp. CCMP2097]|nr:acyl transferase/acyl hydrolase/lysophospholipase [Pelagophyceae sp. CCMP2097]|mmetsp:Transcript_32589/g.112733  ORF Transcript_32589/g.112733 Transcript_32589/m.112733 type:complete len:353 (+) Transcript_32589:38-1096(+)
MSVRTGILAASVLCANALVGPRLAKAGRAHGGRSLRMGADDAFASYSAKTTFLFPGQGAQAVGMAVETCAAVPAAAALFARASEIVGYDLLAKCRDGPKESLDTTEVCQPAIFVASMAAVEKLRSESGQAAVDACTCAMGLSLGEYSALCFAGALTFDDGVRLTQLRGKAMQAAADAVDTGMVSVIGLDSMNVAALCLEASARSGGKIEIANYLCNGNYAVSGDKAACALLCDIAKPEFGARMVVKLAVAGAFHTKFMSPAVEALAAALSTTTVSAPRIPVVSNVDAKPHSDPAVIKELLAAQVTSPVLWEESCNNLLANGYETGYELGPGKVIAGIFKRISKEAEVVAVTV